MGLFHNYTRPGAGISKDAPRPKGFKLFFELFFRKIGSYIKLNLLYLLTLIPAIFIVGYILMTIFLEFVSPTNDAMLITAVSILTLVISLVLCTTFGLSPFSSGFHYILRNFSFEKHAFVFSDFIGKFRENAKSSLLMYVIDLVVVLISILLLRFYLILTFSNSFFMAPLVILIVIMIVYSLMTPYRWTMLVTFDLNKRQIYKNALFLVLGNSKASLIYFLAATVFILILCVLVYLIPVIGILLFILVGFSAFGIICQLNIYQQLHDLISQSPGGHENIK